MEDQKNKTISCKHFIIGEIDFVSRGYAVLTIVLALVAIIFKEPFSIGWLAGTAVSTSIHTLLSKGYLWWR